MTGGLTAAAGKNPLTTRFVDIGGALFRYGLGVAADRLYQSGPARQLYEQPMACRSRTSVIRHAIAINVSSFNTNRMVLRHVLRTYLY